MTPEERERVLAKVGTPEGAERLDAFIQAAQAEGRLNQMSDMGVALLLNAYLDDMDMTTPQFVLILNAVERLKRAAGGPLEETP